MLGDDLLWFTTLAELERVGAAAERLHIAQPTLSRMLARLERRLGVELFDRHGKRIVLNEFGRIYYEHARRARSELDAAAQAVADLADPAKGVVRLSFQPSFGSWLIPQLIGGFRRGSPRISFTLRQGAFDAVVDQIVDGTADLATVSPRPSVHVGWRKLLTQPLALAAPAEHRLASRRQIRFAELGDAEFITMHAGFGMRRIFDELCAAAHIRPRIAFESSDLGTAAGLVAAGLGVALLPLEDPTPAAGSLSGIVTVPLADAGAVRDVGLIWSATAPPSDAVRRFRDFTEDWARRRGGIQMPRR
ncbi:LysR family transcriptional regulator [Nocardia sp. NPDC051990]|uniref:LysR family transcriptional regulator n=1 Tax=Nocardia sp. NPDC051990 TaxID=3155285 RepID=UPI00342B8391